MLSATAESLEHISCQAGTRPDSNWTNSAAADLSKLIFETGTLQKPFCTLRSFFSQSGINATNNRKT